MVGRQFSSDSDLFILYPFGLDFELSIATYILVNQRTRVAVPIERIEYVHASQSKKRITCVFRFTISVDPILALFLNNTSARIEATVDRSSSSRRL